MIWAGLLHLSFNFWADREAPEWNLDHITAKPYLRFDESIWKELTQEMADSEMNMVVLDLGDGVQYESHPEIAVKDAWSVDRLKKELKRLRDLGLEPIPKLNFSTSHDVWLGSYSRMVSSDPYYAVCRDLITEVCQIFEKPRFFHLGMDEETEAHQRFYDYAVIRQKDLWWNDLKLFADCVQNGGSRPWIWSDYVWNHSDEFYDRMDKSILQSNWYYGTDFDTSLPYVKAYLDLEKNCYDQIPTGSNWQDPTNFEKTVAFCKENIPSERLLGFMQSVWRPTIPEYRERHLAAIEQVRNAMKILK